jgi:hypothetical protein
MYVCCPCDVHVMSMCCPCDVHVLSMWCPCAVHVLSMWCPCAVHVLSMCCPCDVHVMSMCCPCDVPRAGYQEQRGIESDGGCSFRCISCGSSISCVYSDFVCFLLTLMKLCVLWVWLFGRYGRFFVVVWTQLPVSESEEGSSTQFCVSILRSIVSKILCKAWRWQCIVETCSLYVLTSTDVLDGLIIYNIILTTQRNGAC